MSALESKACKSGGRGMAYLVFSRKLVELDAQPHTVGATLVTNSIVP